MLESITEIRFLLTNSAFNRLGCGSAPEYFLVKSTRSIRPIGNEKRREAVLPLASDFFQNRFGASLERSNGTNETQLREGGYAVIQPDLFDDLAVFEAKHGRSRETHFATGGGRQGTGEKVAKCGAGVRTSSLPATDYVIAFGAEVGSSPEIEVRESLAEVRQRICLSGL